MRKLNFNEILKSVDDFYWENDNKNRLFNVARKSISILFDRYYWRTQKEKDFNIIDWLEREEIFYQALDDFLNDLSKDIQ
jgi:hypothetical protein